LYNQNVILSYDNVPKTIVVGASGFLGSAFFSFYRSIYPDCIGWDNRTVNRGISFFDLQSPNIAPFKPAETGYKEALIFAAMTKVDACETEKELTRKVNVEGTLKLIRQLVSEGIKPVFFSSDYVFDGEKGNYQDDAPVNPITEYGRQKAEVEEKIKDISKEDYLVVRLSKAFSLTKHDGTLLDEMAGILMSGGTIRAAHDQIFCPTLVSDIIRAVVFLQSASISGVVNVCTPEARSRYDLALELANSLRMGSDRILKVSLDEIGFKSRRPKNTSMIPKRLLAECDFAFMPVTQCVGLAADNWLKG